MSQYALVAIAASIGSGCGEKSPTTATPAPLSARSLDNVRYGTDAAQVMDIRLPAGRSASTPVVVFIHGGGWDGGDKGIFTATDLNTFLARGFACVNINYRLASTPLNIHDPMLSNDVTAALDFVAQQAAGYVVSGSTFGLVGHSAGAHLALLAAYKYDPQRRIKAVASLSGPTDFNAADFLAVPGILGILERYLGVTKAAQPARWTGASPIAQATATSPPTILLQGRLDGLVPFSQAASMHARLVSLNVPDDYRLFATYDHDLSYAAIGRFPDDVWGPTLAWFTKYVK